VRWRREFGIAGGLLAVPLNVLTQWRSPEELRDAVIAFSNTFVFMGVIAGSLCADALSRIGLSPTEVLLAASALAAVGAIGASALPPGTASDLARRLARRARSGTWHEERGPEP
jgi:hypothetical protein